MRALLLAASLVLSGPVFAQDHAPEPSACNERSVDGCLCVDEASVMRWRAQALAFEQIQANPPECREVGGWTAAALSLVATLIGLFR